MMKNQVPAMPNAHKLNIPEIVGMMNLAEGAFIRIAFPDFVRLCFRNKKFVPSLFADCDQDDVILIDSFHGNMQVDW